MISTERRGEEDKRDDGSDIGFIDIDDGSSIDFMGFVEDDSIMDFMSFN